MLESRAAYSPVLTTALCTVALPPVPVVTEVHAEKLPLSNPSLNRIVAAEVAVAVGVEVRVAVAVGVLVGVRVGVGVNVLLAVAVAVKEAVALGV